MVTASYEKELMENQPTSSAHALLF